jgi:hypothetical protein
MVEQQGGDRRCGEKRGWEWVGWNLIGVGVDQGYIEGCEGENAPRQCR